MDWYLFLCSINVLHLIYLAVLFAQSVWHSSESKDWSRILSFFFFSFVWRFCFVFKNLFHEFSGFGSTRLSLKGTCTWRRWTTLIFVVSPNVNVNFCPVTTFPRLCSHHFNIRKAFQLENKCVRVKDEWISGEGNSQKAFSFHS